MPMEMCCASTAVDRGGQAEIDGGGDARDRRHDSGEERGRQSALPFHARGESLESIARQAHRAERRPPAFFFAVVIGSARHENAVALGEGQIMLRCRRVMVAVEGLDCSEPCARSSPESDRRVAGVPGAPAMRSPPARLMIAMTSAGSGPIRGTKAGLPSPIS